MDSSSSSWFSWMTRSTIHERNVARRIRTAQNRNDTRPTLLRIRSVLTAQQPKASNKKLSILKPYSSEDEMGFSADKFTLGPVFDDGSQQWTFDESVSSPVAQSITPTVSSYTGVPMSVTIAGIIGTWMAVRRHTNALPRFHHTSSPMGYAMLAPLNAPHQGLPVSVIRHSSEGIISHHVKWNKLATLLLRTMPGSWTSTNKTRLPFVVLVFAGYEFLSSSVLGPRPSSGKS